MIYKKKEISRCATIKSLIDFITKCICLWGIEFKELATLFETLEGWYYLEEADIRKGYSTWKQENLYVQYKNIRVYLYEKNITLCIYSYGKEFSWSFVFTDNIDDKVKAFKNCKLYP